MAPYLVQGLLSVSFTLEVEAEDPTDACAQVHSMSSRDIIEDTPSHLRYWNVDEISAAPLPTEEDEPGELSECPTW